MSKPLIASLLFVVSHLWMDGWKVQYGSHPPDNDDGNPNCVVDEENERTETTGIVIQSQRQSWRRGEEQAAKYLLSLDVFIKPFFIFGVAALVGVTSEVTKPMCRHPLLKVEAIFTRIKPDELTVKLVGKRREEKTCPKLESNHFVKMKEF